MLLCHRKQPNICLWVCGIFAICIVGVFIILERTQNMEVIGKYLRIPVSPRSTQKAMLITLLLLFEVHVNICPASSPQHGSVLFGDLSYEKNTPAQNVVPSVDILDDFPVKIPSDAELDNMTVNKAEDLFWDYINTIQALCRRVVRVGKIEDGGKEVCIDEPYRPRRPCLVYSFGINNAWDFDEDAASMFGCEVFCFDPSMRDKDETYKYAKDITFYMIGLGDKNEVLPDEWKMRTLEQIRRDLNHTERTIHILKIDIEGSEWTSIPQMVRSGTLRSVNQIQIELHGRGTTVHLKVLRMLYEDGFRIFMRDRNLYCKYSREGLVRERTHCMEVSMMRVIS